MTRLAHTTTIENRVNAVLSEVLYWFPVRHHSPTVARMLEAAIAARKPKVLFIEGPAEANELIPFIVDAKTKPPVAIYSSYRDDDNVLGLAGIASPADDIPPRFSCWYPLLAYSPEYVAMQAARKHGAECVFMDLPHHASIRPHRPNAPGQQEPEEDEAEPKDRRKAPGTIERESDRLIVESDFYRQLAEAAGFRTWNQAWDTMFENGHGNDYESFRRELATFCAAARATSSPERIAVDGTLERERHMLQTIRATLKAKKIKPEQAMVVCGGFHLFLDRDDSQPPPAPPQGTMYVTVVPYSFFRVSELSGYAAGNRAPSFYQRFWDLCKERRGDDVVVEHTVEVLKQARREGEPLSSADAIAVSQHALMLANLRSRARPILDDIHDALISCCCKSDPNEDGLPLRKAMDAVDIGTKIGKVTGALGKLPIVADFHAQLSDLDLGGVLDKEKRLALDLDKREEQAARRSVFLQRLRFLEVPLAEFSGTQGAEFVGGKIFREKWLLRWSPQVEPALIERNMYGDTVESAALGKLQEDLAREENDAGKTCERLVQAIDMDLPNLIREVEDACSKAIDRDGRFVSLGKALQQLTVIDQYAVLRHLRREVLADLIERCYDRACFAIPDVASVPEDQHKEVLNGLLGLAETVQRADQRGLDRALFVEQLRKAAVESTVPFLRGAFLGMLVELREMTAEALAAEVSALAKAPTDRMVTAGDFLDGILAVSRISILLGADALIAAIDELLRAAEWEPFLVMVPRLRAAFERLHERQVDSLAARVAQRYGLAETETLTELRTSVGAAAWIARIDHQVADIMAPWNFATK